MPTKAGLPTKWWSFSSLVCRYRIYKALSLSSSHWFSQHSEISIGYYHLCFTEKEMDSQRLSPAQQEQLTLKSKSPLLVYFPPDRTITKQTGEIPIHPLASGVSSSMPFEVQSWAFPRAIEQRVDCHLGNWDPGEDISWHICCAP